MKKVRFPLTATVFFCVVNPCHPFSSEAQSGTIDATSAGSVFKPNIDTGGNAPVSSALFEKWDTDCKEEQ
jgi:hypothetical protein